MPRSKRKQSGTDVYHVVSRGNNQNHILQKNDDKKYFRSIMQRRAEKFGVKVYAYCIMSNHVHILLKSDFKILSLFMQEVNSIFAIYHNYKYGKSGHVFQGRFYSSAVETEGYLFSCIRYIHNNPVKAYMVSSILDYPFSSAVEYYNTMLHKKNIRGYLSEEIFCHLKKRFRNWEEFCEFHNLFDNQEFIDIKEEKEEYDFERVKRQMIIFARENDIKSFKILDNVPYMRQRAVAFCKRETGMTEGKIENFLKILATGVRPL